MFEVNGFVQSLFAGFGEARKDKRLQNQFDELEWTPFLFSSAYLQDMYNQATSKGQHEAILDHLYKHYDLVSEIPTYMAIEDKIINKWR